MSIIEDKYIKANIKGHYRFENALEVKEVLGFDLREIKGFDKLEDKELAERLICIYLNGFGLEAREKIKLKSIVRKYGKFILRFKDETYSYLYNDGTVG